ncbi:MAG: exodeoxyribonuclease VII large subunit [Phycisphaerales bacterium]|nr:exodeoxyribonuclease VII large subunit [Phycisphaerales bacterium]
MTVSKLAEMIGGALSRGLPGTVAVVGEISNFTDRTHWYFNLKDEGAVAGAVMFQTALRKAAALFPSGRPRDGDKVVAWGRVEFYAKQGRTQLYVERMEPLGMGDLERRFRALFEELKALGYFDPQAKKPLPAFPRRVAVVTSKTGAALHDVLDTMKRRCPAVDAALLDVRVQGEGAAADIARALDWLGEHHRAMRIDAIILTRGGGSIEDLWAFNERAVADAVRRCPVPIVAAIGHETDVTIAELVADERAATPTQAAMRLTPDRAALAEQVEQLGARLSQSLVRSAGRARDRLVRLRDVLIRTIRQRLTRESLILAKTGARLARHRPEAVYTARRAAVREAGDRLHRAMLQALERRRDRVSAAARELAAVGPLRVLGRGYSVTMTPDGRIIRSITDARPGVELATRVADGTIASVVQGGRPGTTPAASDPVPLPPRRPLARGRAKPADPRQMDLF